MSLLMILIALSVLVAACVVVTRRRREGLHATRPGSVHPESLLADPDDAQGRTERAARRRRRAVRRGGGRPALRE